MYLQIWLAVPPTYATFLHLLYASQEWAARFCKGGRHNTYDILQWDTMFMTFFIVHVSLVLPNFWTPWIVHIHPRRLKWWQWNQLQSKASNSATTCGIKLPQYIFSSCILVSVTNKQESKISRSCLLLLMYFNVLVIVWQKKNVHMETQPRGMVDNISQTLGKVPCNQVSVK